MKKGYTIVEILVVISILAIVGVLILFIFTNSLRENNKAQVLSSIKKNGQTVLDTLDKSIRDADNVVCVSNDISANTGSSIVIVKSGLYTRYRFVFVSGQNGTIEKDNPVKQTDPLTGKPETDTVFINRVCGASDPLLPGAVTLTDTDSHTGVSVVSAGALFERIKEAGFRDTITISFKLTYPVGVSSSVVGQIDPVPFSTTVELR